MTITHSTSSSARSPSSALSARRERLASRSRLRALAARRPVALGRRRAGRSFFGGGQHPHGPRALDPRPAQAQGLHLRAKRRPEPLLARLRVRAFAPRRLHRLARLARPIRRRRRLRLRRERPPRRRARLLPRRLRPRRLLLDPPLRRARSSLRDVRPRERFRSSACVESAELQTYVICLGPVGLWLLCNVL